MIDTDSLLEDSKPSISVPTKLYIRYMVSLRCKLIVQDELKKLGINHTILPYGAIEFTDELAQQDFKILKKNLRKSGLDLLNTRESNFVDRIINMIIEVIHYFDELPKLSYTEIISRNLVKANEPDLKIFADVVGMSVIQFIVNQKIERIKELLLYEDVTLAQITSMLNYKNEPSLIAQFKKYTGLTPDYYQKLRKKRIRLISQSKKRTPDSTST